MATEVDHGGFHGHSQGSSSLCPYARQASARDFTRSPLAGRSLLWCGIEPTTQARASTWTDQDFRLSSLSKAIGDVTRHPLSGPDLGLVGMTILQTTSHWSVEPKPPPALPGEEEWGSGRALSPLPSRLSGGRST